MVVVREPRVGVGAVEHLDLHRVRALEVALGRGEADRAGGEVVVEAVDEVEGLRRGLLGVGLPAVGHPRVPAQGKLALQLMKNEPSLNRVNA